MGKDINKKIKGIKVRSIIGIALWITLVGGIVSVVLSIIDSIIILTNDWENEEINDQKLIWGILGLLILGSISTLIFSLSAENKNKKNSSKSNEPLIVNIEEKSPEKNE